MVLESKLEDLRVLQKEVARIEISPVFWHTEASPVSDFEPRQVGKHVERRWSRERAAAAEEGGTGR